MMNKVKIFFWILFLISTGLFSQEILISDGGTVNTCSGTFYDSGGPSGVYGANEDFTISIVSIVKSNISWPLISTK